MVKRDEKPYEPDPDQIARARAIGAALAAEAEADRSDHGPARHRGNGDERAPDREEAAQALAAIRQIARPIPTPSAGPTSLEDRLRKLAATDEPPQS